MPSRMRPGGQGSKAFTARRRARAQLQGGARRLQGASPRCRVWATSFTRLNGSSGPATKRGLAESLAMISLNVLADPELVEEQVPVGVELVVAHVGGKNCEYARVVQRNPRRLVDDFAVDGGPANRGRARAASLGGQCLPGLGIDLVVAELSVVDIASVAGNVGIAREHGVDEVRWRWVVLNPAEEPGLYAVTGVPQHA